MFFRKSNYDLNMESVFLKAVARSTKTDLWKWTIYFHKIRWKSTLLSYAPFPVWMHRKILFIVFHSMLIEQLIKFTTYFIKITRRMDLQ